MRSFRTKISEDRRLSPWHAMLVGIALALIFTSAPILGQNVLQPSVETQSKSHDQRTTRVRIAFGSDAPHVWQAEIEFRGANPGQLDSLSLEPASVGGAWIEGNRLLIRHDQPLRQNAYDITLNGSIDAEIICRIQEDVTSHEPVSFTLREVRREPKSRSFGKAGRIVVERMVEDQFHITFNQPTRIYEPNTPFQCKIVPDTDSLAPGDFFDLHVELAEGRDGKTIWESDLKRFEVPREGLPTCPVEIPLPAKEGIYRVKLEVIRPAGFTSRFLSKGNSRPLAERSFQLLVMDSESRPTAPGDWQEIYSYNPASSKSDAKISEWIDWRKYTRNGEPTIVSSLAKGAKRTAGGDQVVLPSKTDAGAAHWQAYPLAIGTPGKPHLVEIEIKPGASEQLLGLTLLDTNQNGELRELGETVVHRTSRWGDTEKKQIAQILFWPRTSTPLLLMSNPSHRDSAQYGKIRVFKATGSVEPVKYERTVAINWQDANLAKQVGASHAVSPSQLYDYTDLQTHFESAQRIADRVELSGANTAVILINEEGSALTSLDSLRGTPRYDMGTWALGVSDLPKLDLLEVLLHEFDRRGLQLIPNVSLAGPLPILERLRRQPRGEGIMWQSENSKHPFRSAYNLLDPRVRKELGRIGQDLFTAYGKHPSLSQLAIRLDANTPLLFANDEGGFDTATVDHFLSDSKLSWPMNLARTEENYSTAIHKNVPEAWQKWKEQQLHSAYQSLSKVYSLGSQRNCLLIPYELKSNPLLSDLVLPRLGKSSSAANTLQASGLFTLASDQGFADLAIPLSADPVDPLAATSCVVFTNSIEQAAKQEEKTIEKSVRVVTDSRFNYRLADSAKLFAGKLNQQDLSVSCVVADSSEMASVLASQLADTNVTTIIDSGSAAAGWIDKSATKLRRLAAATPVGSMSKEQANPALQDVTLLVTEVVHGNAPGSILTATNRTPWKRKVHITLNVPGRCLAIPISDSPYEPEWYETGQHAMTIDIGPYESLSWRFSTTGINTAGIRLKPVNLAEEQLRSGIESLKKADRTVRRLYQKVSNPSFEEQDELGQPNSWRTVGCTGPIDNISAFEGEHTLQLSTRGEPCSATSDPFPIPETGQLAVLFHAYAKQLAPEARLQIEMLTTDGKYSSQTTVRAEQLLRKQDDGTTNWGELIFAVDDLPLDPQGKMQIRFTLYGEGQLDLDGLRCEDLMLPLPAYAEDLRLQKLALVQLTLAAEQALEEGRLADCKNTLDSYWARFLVNNFPKIEPSLAVEPASEEPTEDSEVSRTEEESPSVADRLRSYWPKMWR